MYLLKTKGKGKIPAHIQIRDERFTLIAYFKVSNSQKILDQNTFSPFKKKLTQAIDNLQYGTITHLLI